jgi:hypothetical protein
MKCVQGAGGGMVQVFPLKVGLVNLTTGTKTGIHAFHCVVDGSVTITWKDSTTSVINCVEGEDYGVIDATSVAITAGTFHLA